MKPLVCLCTWLALIARTKSHEIYTVNGFYESGIDFRKLAETIVENQINVSQNCYRQLKTLYDNDQHALWQLADAWTKFPYEGALYYSSRSDWGNYDECMLVDSNYDGTRVMGKFCAWGWMLPDLRDPNKPQVYMLAYCVPDQCTADDLNQVVPIKVANQTYELFNENYCSTKATDSKLDNGAIVAIAIFATLFLLAVTSTCYDVYLHYAKKKSPSHFYIAFSFYANGKKLLQRTKLAHAGDQILCFNGMKFVSMWWIISGHGVISWWLAPIENRDYRANWQSKRYAQYIMTAHISVDTFFYISGFLMAYLYFKQELSKRPIWQQIKHVPSLILHRYLRLTPANAMCFLGAVYLFKYTQDGPFFSYGAHHDIVEPCKKYWWTYFLYIQNYYNFHYGDLLCIPTTWYLSADFQLFLITPLVIIPLTLLYRRSFRYTMAALVVVNLISLVIPIFAKLHWQKYDPDFQEYDFHSKLISYFIGVMMGVYMRHEKNKKIKISRTTNLILWFIALGDLLAVMLYRQEIQLRNEYVSRSLCYSFTRPMWCLALCWITYACVKGYGGVVNWFLSSSFMQLGGKLTYCLYITHGMIIAHFSLGVKNRLYFSDWHMFYQNCAHFVVSMMVAIFWTLSYESPMITIEKLIFGRGKPSVPKAKVEHKTQDNANSKNS